MTNSVKNDNTKSLEIEEVFIFDISGVSTFMYSEGQFWINLTTIWSRLGIIEQTYLLNCKLQILMNDPDGGLYALLDDFVSICPISLQTELRAQKNRLVAMMESAQ